MSCSFHKLSFLWVVVTAEADLKQSARFRLNFVSLLTPASLLTGCRCWCGFLTAAGNPQLIIDGANTGYFLHGGFDLFLFILALDCSAKGYFAAIHFDLHRPH